MSSFLATFLALILAAHLEQVHGILTYPNRTTAMTGVSFVSDLLVSDFNGDTMQEIIAIGPRFLTMASRLSNGTFSAPGLISLTLEGNEAAECADLDGDGDRDIVVAASPDFATNGIVGAILLLSNNGDNTFATRTLLSRGGLVGLTTTIGTVHGRDIKIADMNGDFHPDILATVSTSALTTASPKGFLLYFENNGAGSFTRHILAEDLGGPALVDVADFNGDGHMDIALVEVALLPRTRALRVLFGADDGTFTSSVIDAGAEGSMGISTGFLNGDSYPDILTIGLKDIVIYYGSPSGSFRKNHMVRFDTTLHKSINYRDWQIAAHDADGDGLKDIVTVYGLNHNVKIMKQSSAESFSALETLVVADNAGEFYLKDLDQDGVVDIAVHSEWDESVYVYYAAGDPYVPPTTNPSSAPSLAPSSWPSAAPSEYPSGQPSSAPSLAPSTLPSTAPSEYPSGQPSLVPSTLPSAVPSEYPSGQPSLAPSTLPSAAPSVYPSGQPLSGPTLKPSFPIPLTQLTGSPTNMPSSSPAECLAFWESCDQDSDCCDFGPDVFCSGKCKPRHYTDKEGTAKLFSESTPRGDLDRRRALKGSQLRRRR
jgi:hypothetical protein